MKALKPLLIKTLIFSIVLGIITAALKYTDTIPLIHSKWHFMLLFYFILAGFIFHKQLKSLHQEHRKFFFSFMTKSILRMGLFIIVILLYTFLLQSDDIQNTVSFIITFTVYYLVYTTWEVILIVPIIKNKNSNPH